MAYAIFIVSGAILIYAGVVLSREADIIAHVTKLGRLFIGSVLLAGATSLPELFTDISAIVLDAPNLAAGDLFGSSMANMLILSVIDLIPPRGRVFQNAAFDHALSASLAISLTAFAAIFILISPQLSIVGISLGSIVLFSVYLAGNRALFSHAKNKQDLIPLPKATNKKPSLKSALIKFSLATLVIAIIAPIFAWSAKTIATVTGLGNTFVGTWLLGISTSLPELAASIAAIRMRAFDLAVGNLFGSNALNMALFFPLDFAHSGPLFFVLDDAHALTALSAIILMTIGLFAITHRAKYKIAVIEPDSWLMLIIYVLSILAIYYHVVPS